MNHMFMLFSSLPFSGREGSRVGNAEYFYSPPSLQKIATLIENVQHLLVVYDHLKSVCAVFFQTRHALSCKGDLLFPLCGPASNTMTAPCCFVFSYDFFLFFVLF